MVRMPSPLSAEALRTLLKAASERGVAAPLAGLPELKALLLSPAFLDAFSPAIRAELTSLLKTLESAPHQGPPRPLGELVTDFSGLKSAVEVPERFASDLLLGRGALIDHPQLASTDRAQRLVAFFGKYAAAFVDLARGKEAAPAPQEKPRAEAAKTRLDPIIDAREMVRSHTVAALTPEARLDAEKHFLSVLEQGGYGVLRDKLTGLDALAVAAAVLKEVTPEVVAQRVAQVDPEFMRPPAAENAAKQVQPQIQGVPKGLAVPGLTGGTAQAPRADVSAQRTTDKVLGRNMLWNVLHTLRGDRPDEDTPEKREAALQALGFGALVVLFGVILLVLMLAKL